jgi:hypothetical protein
LDAAVLVPDGLRAAAEINDAQAPMPQSHLAIHQFAFPVRPAMPEDRIHSGESFPINRFSRKIKNAADAAHGRLS